MALKFSIGIIADKHYIIRMLNLCLKKLQVYIVLRSLANERGFNKQPIIFL
jgi:hypothetical protein